jgi:hypothetical protein
VRARFVSLRTRCHQHTAPLHSGAGHGTASFENKAPILLFACDVCECVCVCVRGESVPPFIQIRYNLIAPRKGRRRRRRHTILSAFSSGMRFISMIVLSTLDQKGAGLAHGFG